ncbi:MAG: hypothetical protein PQ612_08275 [Rickettsiales bacterium]|nr:hypothetical protein [Pseudomonadota bacterium]MDA0966783.1 hypothetical protein [Pseudomonadota bacterium]MDG4543455.1 hypothetical protein [Rickettsiales bacterium]MDG4546151.1 hypothetical protein [Rickettsiales bacterium]MDG4547624.1 hypothetical protein [Rickettsiales bacterium]
MKITLFNVLFIYIFINNISYAGYNLIGVSKSGLLQLDDGTNVKIKNMYVPLQMHQEYSNYINGIIGSDIVELVVVGAVKDLYNNSIVDDIKVGGGSVYNRLLKGGYVLNYNVDGIAVDKEIVEAENNARNLQLGLWAKDKKIFLNQAEIETNTKNHVNKFKVVKGRVKSTKLVKNNMYINFTDDWKTDFTVKIAKENLDNFVDYKIEDLVNKDVIVKGWVEYYYGPAIEVYNQSHINIL